MTPPTNAAMTPTDGENSLYGSTSPQQQQEDYHTNAIPDNDDEDRQPLQPPLEEARPTFATPVQGVDVLTSGGTISRFRSSMIGDLDTRKSLFFTSAVSSSTMSLGSLSDSVRLEDEEDFKLDEPFQQHETIHEVDEDILQIEEGENETTVAVETTPLWKPPVIEALPPEATTTPPSPPPRKHHKHIKKSALHQFLLQIPAMAIVALFHIMMGIPFGVSYFPIDWHNDEFPVPGGKEAVGIRMFLYACMVAQIVLTFTSHFPNAVGLQMVENVPFCHALCQVVMRRQGRGAAALSTVLMLFGISSTIVGLLFFILGRAQLGRIIHFFPTHVLVGCIGGIGVFLMRTAVEVSMDHTLTTERAVWQSKWHLLWIIFALEIILRLLQKISLDATTGEAKYPLLSPVYFCSITPMFYLALYLTGTSMEQATQAGYFFPSLITTDSAETLGDQGGGFFSNLFVLWTAIDVRTFSWGALYDSIPTMVALAMFSLIHVPINIPAFAISSNADFDINNELVVHGYSNLFMGIAGGGGLQNYMAYTLYALGIVCQVRRAWKVGGVRCSISDGRIVCH
jgi:Sulfate permease family